MSIAEKHSKIEKSHHVSLLGDSIDSIDRIAEEVLKRQQLNRAEILQLIGLIKNAAERATKHFNALHKGELIEKATN